MEYLNFIFYLLFTIFAFKKRFSLIVRFYAVLWMTCSFVGIFYYQSSAYKEGLESLSLFPFIFLFLAWIISLYPLMNWSKLNIDTESLFGHNLIVKIILNIISFSSFPVFLELLYVFINSIFTGRIFFMAENYDDLANGYANRLFELSNISNICLHLSFYFQIISPFLLLLYINYKNKKNYILFGLLSSSLTVPLYTICSGSRTGLVFFVLYFISLFLFFYKNYSDKIKTKLMKIIGIAGAFFLSVLILLSLGRFVLGSNYGDDELSNSLFIYTSESMYNFNTMASQTERNTKGDYSFIPIQLRLGLSPIRDLSKRRDYLNSKMDISPIWFYTYIGDFCIDFGYFGSFIIVLFLSLIINRIIRNNFSLPGLCLISIYIYIMSNGLFYFPFQAGDSPFIGCLVLSILLKLIQIPNNSLYK